MRPAATIASPGAMQKELRITMQVQYLRQKCDEKDCKTRVVEPETWERGVHVQNFVGSFGSARPTLLGWHVIRHVHRRSAVSSSWRRRVLFPWLGSKWWLRRRSFRSGDAGSACIVRCFAVTLCMTSVAVEKYHSYQIITS